MKQERKIDTEGHLLDPKNLNKSEFFKLLEKNKEKDISNWLIDKGKIKPYCPMQFIDITKEDL